MFKVIGYKKGSWLERRSDFGKFGNLDKAKEFVHNFNSDDEWLLVVLGKDNELLYCKLFETYIAFDSKINARYLDGLCEEVSRVLKTNKFRVFDDNGITKVEDENNNILIKDLSSEGEEFQTLMMNILDSGLSNIWEQGAVENFIYNKSGNDLDLFYIDSGLGDGSFDVFLCDVHPFLM